MKEFNIQSGEGEYIIHLNGNNSLYEVVYDHGQITFQNAGLKYIIPENVGNKLAFQLPDPNTGKRTYITDNVRSLYRDTTPTDFGLTNLTGVTAGSSHFTEEIIVGGINESIAVVAPVGVVIWVNGSAVSSGSTVEVGDVVKFEITASSEFETTSNFNLSVGDITKTFSITTEIGVRNSCLEWRNLGYDTSGIYKINPGGTTIDAYCDMVKDGGGWTLLLTGRGDNVSYMGWDRTNIYSRNESAPSMVNAYSIIGKGDLIKKAASGWQYMIEASLDSTTRYTYGGIFTANGTYSISSTSNTQTNVTANEWFSGVSGFVADSGISQIVPHIGSTATGSVDNIVYTTDNGPSSWWGTLIQTDAAYSSYHIGPWLSGILQSPNWMRMWIR